MIAYLLTNKINGKKYVGVTTMTLRRRWSSQRSEALGRSNRVLCKALRKYGWKSFDLAEIAVPLSADNLGILESILVKQYGSRTPFGYNMTDGGDGTPGRRHSDEAKKKISAASKGHCLSLESRQKISSAHIGKRLSFEHRQKLSAAKTGRKRPLRTAEHCARISAGLRSAWLRRKGSS